MTAELDQGQASLCSYAARAELAAKFPQEHARMRQSSAGWSNQRPEILDVAQLALDVEEH